ncbi:retrotransposon protein, putative, ty1-copia subclass, partial [Tanacetum coccineum]
MDKVRHLLIQSRLPKTFWAEATYIAAYLINRSPSTIIEKKTPMDMWSGHPSDYGMLRIFVYVIYSHVEQGKLELRAVKCDLLGYPEGVKEYILYRLDDESPKIVSSRNVVFNKSVMYKDMLKDSGAGADKSVEELHVECTIGTVWVNMLRFKHEAFGKFKEWKQVVDHPAGQKLVSCKWLFKIKEGIEGVQKPRYKARLVACEFTQRADIYMRQPTGYEQGNKVCLLKNSLYDLKESPRQWYRRFDDYMSSNGFKRNSYVYCVYYRSYALGEYIYLLLYVDDMLIACKSKAEIGFTKSLLKKEFDMKEPGEAKKIIGMEIVRNRSRKILRVSQSGYVSKILNNFRIDNGKSVQMPLGGNFKLSLKDFPVRDYDVERMSKVSYANVVGSLMYLMVCMRPDISTNRGNHMDVTGFVDSDYAKDLDKGRSMTGYAFLGHGCVVSWKEMLQHMVALSTTKAEYMALAEAVKEAIWLRGLLEEFGVELNTVAVNCDNQGAIHLSRNHVFHERTKHINVLYHFIREVLEAKTVKVLKVGTEHNVVDALMNVVPRLKLQHCLELLN